VKEIILLSFIALGFSGCDKAPAKNGVPSGDSSGDRKFLSGKSLSQSPSVEFHKRLHPELDKEVLPKLSTDGKIITYDLGEGRVAQLMYTQKPTLKGIAKFQIQENTCGKPVGQNCLYAVHAFAYKTKIVWSKHTDPRKVGQTVEYTYSYSGDVEDEADYEKMEYEKYYGIDVNSHNKILKRDFKDYIACSDWNWLSAEPVTTILAWHGESMLMNSETKQNENTKSNGVYSLELIKFDDESRQMTQPKFFDSRFGNLFFGLAVGDVASMTYEEENQTCMASFKIDNTEAIAQFREYEEAFEDNYLPYREGQDNMLKLENETDRVMRDTDSKKVFR
jgi:hypothetical protein